MSKTMFRSAIRTCVECTTIDQITVHWRKGQLGVNRTCHCQGIYFALLWQPLCDIDRVITFLCVVVITLPRCSWNCYSMRGDHFVIYSQTDTKMHSRELRPLMKDEVCTCDSYGCMNWQKMAQQDGITEASRGLQQGSNVLSKRPPTDIMSLLKITPCH